MLKVKLEMAGDDGRQTAERDHVSAIMLITLFYTSIEQLSRSPHVAHLVETFVSIFVEYSSSANSQTLV